MPKRAWTRRGLRGGWNEGGVAPRTCCPAMRWASGAAGCRPPVMPTVQAKSDVSDAAMRSFQHSGERRNGQRRLKTLIVGPIGVSLQPLQPSHKEGLLRR